MAKEIILSKEEKVLLDFSELLKNFIFGYGKMESECINGEFRTTISIPERWVNLIESVSKSKFCLTGCIKVLNSESFNILRDFLLKYDNIANGEIVGEAINILDGKIELLYEKGIINIDVLESTSIASEIISCYFHPIVSFGDEYLYYTDGDIQKLLYYLSTNIGASLIDGLKLLPLFIRDIMAIPPKYRIISLLSIIDYIDKKERTYNTYIGTDSSGMYKIGRTSNLIDREKSIKTGNHSYRTVILIKGDFENEIHKLFSEKNIRGEWFALSNIDLNYIISNYDIIFNRIASKNLLKV